MQSINHLIRDSTSYETKAHGGEIKVETKEGEGTSFIIEIPVTKQIS